MLVCGNNGFDENALSYARTHDNYTHACTHTWPYIPVIAHDRWKNNRPSHQASVCTNVSVQVWWYTQIITRHHNNFPSSRAAKLKVCTISEKITLNLLNFTNNISNAVVVLVGWVNRGRCPWEIFTIKSEPWTSAPRTLPLANTAQSRWWLSSPGFPGHFVPQ